MKKRIISIISAIAMMLAIVAIMPAEKAMASSSISIGSVSISQTEVDASTRYAVITVKVAVTVAYPYDVSSINVRLDNYGGTGESLLGSLTTGFSGSGVYAVDVAVPSDVHGTYVVRTVTASATDGTSDYKDNLAGYDSVYVANSAARVMPPFVQSVDTQWIKKNGENVLRFRVSGYGSTGFDQVGSIVATFNDKNGNKVDLTKFVAEVGGYYTSTIKESEVVGTDVYSLTQLVVKDTSGNEVLYYFPDETVTINGNIKRSFPARLTGTSFVAGGASQPATIAPSKTTTTTTETKSPTTGQGNVGMAAVIIAALGVAVVGLFAIAAKKISSR